MKTTSSITALIWISILMLSSCEMGIEPYPDQALPIILTAEQHQLVESSNDFAFDLFSILTRDLDEEENIVISPLSISYALAMLANGADGATLDGILETLRIPSFPLDKLNESYSGLTKALLGVDRKTDMRIANSVWIEDMFSPKNPFIKSLTRYYQAEIHNFSIDDPGAPDAINAWIKEKTKGLIEKMVEDLPGNTVMMLINAIYFKSGWRNKFDAGETRDMPFYISPGRPVNIPMMFNKDKIRATETDGFIVAELPYGQGNFVMNVILPPEQEGAAAAITREQFNGWIASLNQLEAELHMPRFKFGFKQELKGPLMEMGMASAFSAGEADLSKISDLDLYVSDALHQAHIETNEDGTEAAAVTTITIGYTSVPQILGINLNRPFFFIIRETETNSILFMGRVSDPS